MHMCDIVIKNGRLLDPAAGIDREGDLLIRDGVLVSEPGGGGESRLERVLDAAGCLVVPGLIDSHIHVFQGGGSRQLNTSADLACIPAGVTTCIDGGSAGPLNFESFLHGDMAYSRTRIRALLHVSHNGVLPAPYDEDEDPGSFDEARILALFDQYPNELRGLKVRQHRASAGRYGLEPQRRTVEIAGAVEARGHRCSVAVHVGELPDGVTIEGILDTLRPGDVFTHTYQQSDSTIFGREGKVLPCLWEGRKRGILFDSGTGRIHFTLDNLRAAFAEGFFPDLIGTDLVGYSLYTQPVFSMARVLSMLLSCGMPLPALLTAVTRTPAATYGLPGGTLAPGAPADVSILQLRTGPITFRDTRGGRLQGDRCLVPMATIRGGKLLFQQVFLPSWTR